jgi:hypothetical protein
MGKKKGRNKIGRNDPCACDSGKKYKNCCLEKVEAARARTREQTNQAAIGHVHGPDCDHGHDHDHDQGQGHVHGPDCDH